MADQPCTIGKQITIRGNVSGAEDLVIEGRVEGTINLSQHLTIAAGGEAEADIQAEQLTIDGTVSGEIDVTRGVVVSAEARVTGNVRSPRVVLEDGARFRGRIEMEVDLPEGVGD